MGQMARPLGVANGVGGVLEGDVRAVLDAVGRVWPYRVGDPSLTAAREEKEVWTRSWTTPDARSNSIRCFGQRAQLLS